LPFSKKLDSVADLLQCKVHSVPKEIIREDERLSRFANCAVGSGAEIRFCRTGLEGGSNVFHFGVAEIAHGLNPARFLRDLFGL
jgi:hypothetical protein